MGNVTQEFGLNIGLNSSSFKLSNIQVFASCIDPGLAMDKDLCLYGIFILIRPRGGRYSRLEMHFFLH